jgi:predicted nuclease of predicted toxin-antitoxin system
MKLLVDACAGRRLARALETGHEVVFAGDWERDPGDDEIFALARVEHRVIITRDKDFGTIAVRDRQKVRSVKGSILDIDSAQADICETRIFQQNHYQELTPNRITAAAIGVECIRQGSTGQQPPSAPCASSWRRSNRNDNHENS